ncbi:peptidoglycan-binding protein [Yinghuangia sp. ASG 101]|uniref:peptidoglycan-binding protein n=1 Tax=Yinghuangia sp. ASG 101 TaxID=2896848 RepID=UPI001E47364C|nr:peptidoglycan-binding protein [Yinghuangia sp. ASG 101]UGQ10434.1 peptidoglycan-binding protein [Yinghuangia sp. ASG 101]
MSRWKELPVGLDASVCRLVVHLRRLKDHGGLTMRQLAAKTGYSAKSWERYLGGRSLPPREAVEALARIGGEDPARLRALHEVAAEAWKGGRGSAARTPHAEAEPVAAPEPERPSEPVPPDGTAARPRRRGRYLVHLAAAVLVPAAAITVYAVVRHAGGGEKAAATRPAPTYTCRVERIDGRWYAGNSRTQDAIVAYGLAGPDVAEAQCLLERAGFAPGDIDGIYGPLTQSAVKRAQRHAGLVVDGIVGPHTWEALRR